MTSPSGRAALAAAVGALTDHLDHVEAGTPRSLGHYLQQLVDDEGVGALAQGYYGLLHLSALLLPAAAEAADTTPRELLTRIGLRAALEE